MLGRVDRSIESMLGAAIIEVLKSSTNSGFGNRMNGSRLDEGQTKNAFGKLAGADNSLRPQELLGGLKPFVTTNKDGKQIFDREGFVEAATTLGVRPEAAKRAFDALSGGKGSIPVQDVVDFANERALDDGTWRFPQFRDVVRDLSNIGKAAKGETTGDCFGGKHGSKPGGMAQGAFGRPERNGPIGERILPMGRDTGGRNGFGKDAFGRDGVSRDGMGRDNSGGGSGKAGFGRGADGGYGLGAGSTRPVESPLCSFRGADRRGFEEGRTKSAFETLAGADDNLQPAELVGGLKPFITSGDDRAQVFERDGFVKAATTLGLQKPQAERAFQALAGGKDDIPVQAVVDFANERARPDGSWSFLQFRDVVRDLAGVGKTA